MPLKPCLSKFINGPKNFSKNHSGETNWFNPSLTTDQCINPVQRMPFLLFSMAEIVIEEEKKPKIGFWVLDFHILICLFCISDL